MAEPALASRTRRVPLPGGDRSGPRRNRPAPRRRRVRRPRRRAPGSGKSTLLRAACGLVPHFHGGEVAGRIAGRRPLDTREHGPAELARRRSASCCQEPETQVVIDDGPRPSSSCRSSCAAPARSAARAVEEAALALAIEPLLDRTTDSLSGGELQRVALAAALVTRPRTCCCSTSRPRSSTRSPATS